MIEHPFIVKMNWAFQSVSSTVTETGPLLIHGAGFLRGRRDLLPYEQGATVF